MTGRVNTVEGLPTFKMQRLASASIDALVATQQVYVHLQPIVDLSTGEVFGYESLVRCSNKEMASPLQLLAAAAEQGAIGRLGRFLRQQATRAVPGSRLFLNVHPDEFDEEWLQDPNDPIFTHDADVVIEIPESAPLVRYRFANSTLSALRKRGIKVALDDFGAGYSNIGYIATLAPEIVKIDRELIAGVEPGSRQQRLLASLNALCAAQGAWVVAEGIETQRELSAVIEAGVPLAQGYFLGRPSPTGAVTWKPVASA